MTPLNQRKFEREHTRLPACLSFDWGDLEGFVENIGEGGAFFVTDTLEGTVDVGDPLALNIYDGAPDIRGSILRVDRYLFDGELLRSFAIRFERPYSPHPELGARP